MITKVLVICLLASFAQSEDVFKTIVVSKKIFNPNGYPRRVISVQAEGVPQTFPFPGPLLRATKGDTMHITYKNQLETSISIHCHGVHMHNNPWMDGVTGITECGIAPGNSFTYVFNLTQTGTYWYHDHSHTMYGDGLLGPIIIDYPASETDPVRNDFPYTQEHVIMMQDWMLESTSDLMAYYKGPYGSYPGFQPKYPWPTTSLLINGRGSFDCKYDDCSWLPSQNMTNVCETLPQCIPVRPPLFGTCDSQAHPMQEFACPAGEYVRLRLINGATNLALRFWIDRHNLTIVARDGIETKYLSVTNVTVAIAQRIDVIVKCDQDADYQYMINIAPSSRMTDLKNITASALLVYNNATEVQNPIPMEFTSDVYFEYKHLDPKEEVVSPRAVERLVIVYSEAYTTKPGFPLEEWVLNNVSFIYPSQPLLPAYYQGTPISDLVRSEIGSKNLRKTIIQPLVFNQVYEIVIIGNQLTAHPWHIHGHYLDFLEAGSIRPFIETNYTDECNQTIHDVTGISKLLSSLPDYDKPRNAVGKGDSFMVPGFGYVVFRLTADNAGPWMFHCHIEWHMALGMAMLFSVENRPGEYDLVPPIGMPESCVPTTVLVASEDGGTQYGLVVATSVLGLFLLVAMPFAGYGAYTLKQHMARKYGVLK